MFKDCEMFRMNLCLGCTGLAEQDWVGKYECPTYNRIKKRKCHDNNRYTATLQTQKK